MFGNCFCFWLLGILFGLIFGPQTFNSLWPIVLVFELHTLHSTLRTPHFALPSPLYTVHSTLHAWHSTSLPYTLNFTPHTLHFAPHTLHFTLHTPQSPSDTLHATFPTLTLHSTFHPPHFAPHSTPHATVYSALVRLQGKNVQDCSNNLYHKRFLSDCIRVRGLHLILRCPKQLRSDSCSFARNLRPLRRQGIDQFLLTQLAYEKLPWRIRRNQFHSELGIHKVE